MLRFLDPPALASLRDAKTRERKRAMSDSFEFKIDPNKYRGLSLEEARRAMAEDERRAINEDPRTRAFVRNMERREQARQAEQQRLIEEDRHRQRAEVTAALEDERQQRL